MYVTVPVSPKATGTFLPCRNAQTNPFSTLKMTGSAKGLAVVATDCTHPKKRERKPMSLRR